MKESKLKKFIEKIQEFIKTIKTQLSKLVIAAKRKFAKNGNIVLSKDQYDLFMKYLGYADVCESHPDEDKIKKLNELLTELKSCQPSSAKTETVKESAWLSILHDEYKAYDDLTKIYNDALEVLREASHMDQNSEKIQQYTEECRAIYEKAGFKIKICEANISAFTFILSQGKTKDQSSEEDSASESFIDWYSAMMITE